MSAWQHAGLICDGCGAQYCCGHERIITTRIHAAEHRGWRHVPHQRHDGRTIWRDLCPDCWAWEDAQQRRQEAVTDVTAVRRDPVTPSE